MFRSSVLVLAILSASAAARAINPATGGPMDEREAFERVRTARSFDIASGGKAGQTTLQERAFLRVLNGPQPTAKFEMLAAKGTLAGRMYALLGLKYTAPQVFAQKLPAFLRSWRKVPVAVGPKKTKTVWAKTIAAQIRDRDDVPYLESLGWTGSAGT